MARVKPPRPPPAMITLGLRGDVVVVATGAIGSGVDIFSLVLYVFLFMEGQRQNEWSGARMEECSFLKAKTCLECRKS